MRPRIKVGLLGLFTYLSLGMLLEYLLFLEAGFYLEDEFLRRLWNLAHAHGTLFWVVYLVYVMALDHVELHESLRLLGTGLAAAGAALLPLGFLLGAIGHGEQHPSWPILLVPAGGALLGAALLLPLFAGSESRQPTGTQEPASLIQRNPSA